MVIITLSVTMNNSLNCEYFILMTNSIFVFRTLDTEMLSETFPVKQKTSRESANDAESSKNKLFSWIAYFSTNANQ